MSPTAAALLQLPATPTDAIWAFPFELLKAKIEFAAVTVKEPAPKHEGTSIPYA